MEAKSLRPKNLREKDETSLESTLKELQKELQDLKISKVSSGVASKLAKIRVVRKAIARILTLLNEKRRNGVKNAFRNRKEIRAYNEANGTNFSTSQTPRELRARKTRALRRRLTKKQRGKKLLKTLKKEWNFPQRVYALKA